MADTSHRMLRMLTEGTKTDTGGKINMIYNGPAVFKRPEFCIKHGQ
jgi:hypothetical protein